MNKVHLSNEKTDALLRTIGANLRAAREAQGKTPTEVARTIGRKSNSAGNKITAIEKAEVSGLTIGLAVKLGCALGMEPAELFGAG